MAATLVSQMSKLSLVQLPVLQQLCSQLHTQSCPLLFRATQQLWAEPMKKKKRADPALVAARQAKRMKKLDKEIRRLGRFGRILKPVEEIEMSLKKLSMARERKRVNPALNFEETESRALLQKEWINYRKQKWHYEYKIHERLVATQQEALVELRAESEDLYQAALQIDYGFIPFHFQGPKLTPAIKNYVVPDGEYVDMTRKY